MSEFLISKKSYISVSLVLVLVVFVWYASSYASQLANNTSKIKSMEERQIQVLTEINKQMQNLSNRLTTIEVVLKIQQGVKDE
jgi:predicted PurR-regulated permease PerM